MTTVDIDEEETERRLLEEQEQYEQSKNVGSGDGNGHADKDKEEDEIFHIPKEEDQEEAQDEELAEIKLTNQDIDFAINTIIKEAKYDELSIMQIIHGFNSTLTKLPIPHIVNSKNSGAGKSYMLNHVAKFYPEKYIMILAGMSDKAIFHSDGPMVIEDERTGEVKLLDPITDELEEEIEELREQDAKGNKNRKQIKEIETEIKDLRRRAQKLIDLNNKIIIIQDTPQPTVFNLLMTLLSQDSPKDQVYAFTDKSSGSGSAALIQSRNRIRGMPVLFTTQVIDDTSNERFEEKSRRFIQVTPDTSREKIREANRITGYKYGYLPDEYDQLVVSREDIEKTKHIIKVIVAKLKRHTKYLTPKHPGVKIPYVMTVLESLPDDGQVWQMTVAERLTKYLSMNTKLHMDERPKLIHKATGAFYPIATFEDLKDTLVLMERAATNMRPYLAQWYNEVFLPSYRALGNEPKDVYNDLGIPYAKEPHVGITTEELAIATHDLMQVNKPSIEEVRKHYLDPLVNLGLIEKTQSVRNNSQNIYYPVDDTTNSNSSASSNSNNKKILVRDPNLYPSKNLIEEEFRTLVKHDAGDTTNFDRMTDYRIEDEDGKTIEVDELADRYFNNPEDYFEKGFDETRLNEWTHAFFIANILGTPSLFSPYLEYCRYCYTAYYSN